MQKGRRRVSTRMCGACCVAHRCVSQNAEYAKQIDEAEQRVRELEARVRQQLDLKEIIGEPAEPVETKQVAWGAGLCLRGKAGPASQGLH